MALAKEYRLKKKKDFEEIKKKGRRARSPLFSLLVSFEPGQEGPKFGLVVTKKIDPRAVVRNKIRRRLAEGVRQILPQLRKDLRAVIIARPAIKEANFSQIINWLRRKFGEFAEKK